MHFSLKIKYTYKVNKTMYYYRLQMFLTTPYGCKNYYNPYKDKNDKDI